MKEFLGCPCSGGTLDKLIQPAILAVLSEEPSHGYRIAERIGEIPDFVGDKPDVSGIYRFLKNMESNGSVVSSWDTPGRGHAKRLYEITPAGKACLAQWVGTLERHLTTITALLDTTRAAVSGKSSKRACGCGKPKKRRATLAE
jgi:PadR family transcriptional regulator, regulatory protein PadR